MTTYSKLLANIFDRKTVAILSIILQKTNEFGIRELSREAKVSVATTYRIIQKLTTEGLVNKKIRGKSTYYKLVRNAKKFDQLYKLLIGELPSPHLILRTELERKIGSNFKIIKTGRGKSEKFFVICNENISIMHNHLVNIIFEKTGQKPAIICISPAQFEQMRGAGFV